MFSLSFIVSLLLGVSGLVYRGSKFRLCWSSLQQCCRYRGACMVEDSLLRYQRYNTYKYTNWTSERKEGRKEET